MLLVGIGLASGIAASAGLRKFIEGQIFGVQPMQPSVVSVVVVSLVVVALIACAVPARRATRVDPVTVLNA